MRLTALTILACICAASSARAEPECGDLIDRVTAAAGAELAERSADFARFTAGPETSLTLSCGGVHPSSVGAQHRSDAPPDTYFDVFGRAGEAVTGIAADLLRDAAHRAQDGARRLRHSTVEAGGARITCSIMKNEKGPLTLCAVIEQADRT
ncbi:hypothetical protein [Methylobacterium sp. Leaf118]|uniref:hypothetical protein n=1 Tax=Methylobacterium sp. Leaf118 TaxID=2876562 RepID=UPI001E464EAD|nr:hypothetical protein [Methylobacterium sp. Leaf118]